MKTQSKLNPQLTIINKSKNIIQCIECGQPTTGRIGREGLFTLESMICANCLDGDDDENYMH